MQHKYCVGVSGSSLGNPRVAGFSVMKTAPQHILFMFTYETSAIKYCVAFLHPALDSIVYNLNGNVLYQPPKRCMVSGWSFGWMSDLVAFIPARMTVEH